MKAKTFQERASEQRAADVYSAKRVLADPDQHGGEDSAMVRWARLVMRVPDGAKVTPKQMPTPKHDAQGKRDFSETRK